MNRIVIFSSARSGGNLLDEMLSQYESVLSFGELFSRKQHNTKSFFLKDIPDLYSVSNKQIIDTLEKKYHKTYNTWTSRYHNAHFRFSFNQTIYEDLLNFKKILLYRENFLNKIFSFNVAIYLKNWHYTYDETPPDYSKFKLYYNPGSLIKDFKRTKSYYNNLLERYDDLIVIKYEDLIQWKNLDHITIELGINTARTNKKIPTQHINKSDDGYKNIINLKELNSCKLILKDTEAGLRFA